MPVFMKYVAELVDNTDLRTVVCLNYTNGLSHEYFSKMGWKWKEIILSKLTYISNI